MEVVTCLIKTIEYCLCLYLSCVLIALNRIERWACKSKREWKTSDYKYLLLFSEFAYYDFFFHIFFLFLFFFLQIGIRMSSLYLFYNFYMLKILMSYYNIYVSDWFKQSVSHLIHSWPHTVQWTEIVTIIK